MLNQENRGTESNRPSGCPGLISVIIPAYNAADTLGNQLDMLKAQTYAGRWEVVVVDNRSTDHTIDLVKSYQAHMPNLRYVEAADKQGKAHACNIGVERAEGDLLVFIDADDEVAPGWLAAMARALSEHDFVAGRLDPVKLNEPRIRETRLCPQQQGLQEYKYPPYLPHAAGSNLGVKRVLHQAIGGYDEALIRLQDTEYCWRIQLMGVKLHFAPDALVHYRFRESIAGMLIQSFQWGEYNVLLYKRYRPLGMPKLSWRAGLAGWFKLGKELPQLRRRKGRMQWLRRFFWRLGRLSGSLKYRTLAI